MTFVADAQERLSLTRPAPPIDRRRSAPQTPIQALYNDTDKVEALSEASRAAFGHPITYSHHDGHWRLRLGEPAIQPSVTGRHMFPTSETRQAIEDLPVVEEQGDGLRSYLGVLLELLAERHVFIVLDEPEAFLHPPQARQLATAIMKIKQPHAQLFVATHDSNFVRGLLDARGVSSRSSELSGAKIGTRFKSSIRRLSQRWRMILSSVTRTSLMPCSTQVPLSVKPNLTAFCMSLL